MNKYFYYLFALSLLYIPSIQGQTLTKFEQAVLATLDSTNYYTYDDFFGAGPYDSLNVKDQFQFAEAARRMKAYDLAAKAYNRTIHLDSLENKESYPQAVYLEGFMQKTQGNYAAAIPLFEQYLATPPPVDNYYLAAAQKSLKDCQFALERMKEVDSNYEIKHLGPEINSKYADFAPLLVGKELYYSSLKYEINPEKVNPPRLFAKTLVSDFLTEGQEIDNFNQNNETIAHVALSDNAQRIYFTKCIYEGKKRKLNCNLYYRDKDDGEWGPSQKLPNHINLNGCTTTQPSIATAEDGSERLYFVSNRPDGKGGFDIWYSKIADNTFGKVYNHEVNTAKNEVTPFFHTPTQTMYFSTDAKLGLGGYDIYSFHPDYATKDKIKHEGYPLNSSFNDLYFTLDPSGEKGHFTSNRQGCIRLNTMEQGCEDIFSIQYVQIDLKVLAFDDATNTDLLGARVLINELAESNCKGVATKIFEETQATNSTFLKPKLKKDTWYQIITTKENYTTDTLCFNTNNITQSTEIIKEVRLKPSIYRLNLLALTFDENFTPAIPLSTCIVQLEDIDTGELFIKDNPNGNSFDFPIFSNKEYRLIASAAGYIGDTLSFNTLGLPKNEVVTKNLYLKADLIELNNLLPLVLYFDNDQPNPKTRGTTTSSNYEDLFYPYYRKKGEFIANYANRKTGVERLAAEEEVTAFFEEDLKYNYDTLGLFSEGMISFLRSGRTAVISIRGFASPLAQSDYNDNLSSRRVSCLMNHFNTYRNGVFQLYIQSGQLTLQREPLGENPFSSVSNSKDKIDAIYSPAASLMRKVEIVEVAIGGQFNN